MTRIKYLLPILALFVSVCAKAIVATGDCGKNGNNVTWDLTGDGTLTLYGSGQMKDFDGGVNSPWYDWSDRINKVVISDGITSIGECSFNTCELITSITIPNSVTSIGTWAIGNCKNLTSVRIPESVTSIGNYAFAFCSKLADVTCKATKVPTIGSDAFMFTLASSGTLHVPEASIGDYKKAEQWKLWKNIVADAPDVIASGNCGKSVDNVKWSLTDDGVLAFTGTGEMEDFNSSSMPWGTYSDYITKLSISEGVTTIGDYAIFLCKNITSVEIPNTVTSIGKSAFSDCYNLVSVTIPNSVASIGIRAFKWCNSLASVTIPNSVTKIESETFSDCMSLASVTISNSVKSIGSYAFFNCSSLTSVTIPNFVTSIERYAFGGCKKLTKVTCAATKVPGVGEEVFKYVPVSSVTLTVPLVAVDNYKNAEQWKDFGNIVGDASMLIASGNCGKNGDNIKWTLTGDGTLTLTGSGEMDDYSSTLSAPWYDYITYITKLSMSGDITSIGNFAFDRCYGLTSVTIPNSVKSIGSVAFMGCSGLTSVTIPNSVTSIKDYTFYECSSLTSITIPNSVTSIEDFAFSFCSDLTSINIPNSVKSIGLSVFNDCSSLTSITIPNSVTSIGESAFYGCSKLTKVTCEATEVPSLGSDMFKNVPVSSATLYVPDAALDKYKNAAQWKDFGNIRAIEELSAEADAAKFKTDNAAILAKTTSTVATTDLDAITKALGDYDKLTKYAQALLTAEKTLLDNLKAKVEDLKAAEAADAAATAEAAKFKTDNAAILAKTTETIASSDLDAIDKALGDYDKLSETAKAKLTDGEKDLLDALKTKAEALKAAEEADAAATAEAAKFKADNAAILAKTTETVASTDIEAINKALEDYGNLSEAAKAKLTDGEKDILDTLKTKAIELMSAEEADAVAAAEAAKFKTDNAAILGKTTETVASSDLDAIDKALGDYDKLSSAAKAKLTDGEKALLDALKTKAEALKAAEEAAAAADAAAKADAENFKADNKDILDKSLDSITPDDLAAIDKALDDYDKLSEAAKAKLTDGEKSDLDSKKTKADELASSISALIKTGADVYYNMNGQRTNRSAKGILIKNGKKVLVR